MKQTRKSDSCTPYDCKCDWPEDCFVQCGSSGIVFTGGDNIFENPLEIAVSAMVGYSPKEHYITAFFEAFPKEPETFIRGEGKTIELAEQKAWEKFNRYMQCSGHEFERRGYENGAGFCKKCGMFKSGAFEPLTICCICEKPTHHSIDKLELWYCEEHESEIPEENKTESYKLANGCENISCHEAIENQAIRIPSRSAASFFNQGNV